MSRTSIEPRRTVVENETGPEKVCEFSRKKRVWCAVPVPKSSVFGRAWVRAGGQAADSEIGDTADLESCATSFRFISRLAYSSTPEEGLSRDLKDI